VEVHLIDGTYELFRHFYALPSELDRDGHEVAAARGVVASVQGMIRSGATRGSGHRSRDRILPQQSVARL
jgi:hypothetical protein